MQELVIQNARTYASQHRLRLAEPLGFGIHGIVFVVENNTKPGKAAVKVHRVAEPFQREFAVYERLREACDREILGFNVPQLIRVDDRLLVIEMTVVARPFVLDFAGAYLHTPPDFSEETWAEWEAEKREQFDRRWSKVQAVLGALEALGIHPADVSPSNIAFLD